MGIRIIIKVAVDQFRDGNVKPMTIKKVYRSLNLHSVVVQDTVKHGERKIWSILWCDALGGSEPSTGSEVLPAHTCSEGRITEEDPASTPCVNVYETPGQPSLMITSLSCLFYLSCLCYCYYYYSVLSYIVFFIFIYYYF